MTKALLAVALVAGVAFVAAPVKAFLLGEAVSEAAFYPLECGNVTIATGAAGSSATFFPEGGCLLTIPRGDAGQVGPQGVPGSAGTDGATWRSGSGAPSDGTGVNGDFYFRTDTSDVYKRSSGSYSIIANLKGSAGAAGTNGTNGVSGYQIVSVSDPLTSSSGDTNRHMIRTVSCPGGKKVLGGGMTDTRTSNSEGTGNGDHISQSGPTADGTGWTVDFYNSGASGTFTLTTFAVCATVT